MISLLTLNTWKDEGDWDARIDAVADGLKRLRPDIVCLQEVYAGGGRDTGAALASATGMVCTHAPARHKVRNGVSSSSGVAILSYFKPKATTTIDLPTSPQDGGRRALMCLLDTAAGPLGVACVHLSHLRGREAADLRAAQLRCVLDHLQAQQDGPLVVAGDFNALWRDPEMAAFGEPAWTSTARALAGCSSLIGRPGALIDHIALLGRGVLRLDQVALAFDRPSPLGVMASDHAGVLAVLSAIGPTNSA